jgi:hypothetical protein
MTPEQAARMLGNEIRRAIEGAERAGFTVDFNWDHEWGDVANLRLEITPPVGSAIRIWPIKEGGGDAPEEEAQGGR